MDPYLEDSHSKRVYISGFRREFRHEVYRESVSIRVHHFWCTPPDGVPSLSNLIILLYGCRRLRLILQSVVVDYPCSTEISQSSTEVRINEDIRLKHHQILSVFVLR
jgi:hypothetical protein